MQDTGSLGQALPDPEVLAYTKRLNRALLTLNRRDFIRLHLASPDHAGIIVCTLDPDCTGQARRIDAALRAKTSLRGELIRVNRLSN